MLTRMSDSPKRDPRARASGEDAGVLANLPRTRPQRASPRRTAARSASVRKAPARDSGKARIGHAKANGPVVESVPMQGYESESDPLSRPIQPPGGAELAVSIAELTGELAKAGVSTGARLLKDLFSRLPPG